jgi:type IV pilus assembly protein PilX
MMPQQARFKAPQSGMVLVTALLLLIVVTILAVGMFRSFGLDERIAGNVREKHRALNAAETAEQYAEYWLINGAGNATTGTTCSTVVASTAGQVCSNVLSTLTNVSNLPWLIGGAPVGVTYTPTAMNVQQIAPVQGSYYQPPIFYVSYLGPTPTGLGKIYQIDAAGYGGSPDTAAVIETTYAVQTSVSCLGGCGQ